MRDQRIPIHRGKDGIVFAEVSLQLLFMLFPLFPGFGLLCGGFGLLCGLEFGTLFC